MLLLQLKSPGSPTINPYPSLATASGVQFRRRRASRVSVVSPSKLAAASTSCDRSTSSKVLTLTTAYRAPSMLHVTIGITRRTSGRQDKSAVLVPNRYRAMRESSVMRSWKRPPGCEVQAALCFVHKPQPQARTGMAGPDRASRARRGHCRNGSWRGCVAWRSGRACRWPWLCAVKTWQARHSTPLILLRNDDPLIGDRYQAVRGGSTATRR